MSSPRESKYLSVAVPTPLRRTFHYRIPPGVDHARLSPGIRVKVPFGRRTLVGVLLEITSTVPVDDRKLKTATAILDQDPVLAPALMRLCRWAADYYHHPVGEVLAAALPALLRKGEAIVATEEHLMVTERALGLDLSGLKRAPAQSALLRMLREEDKGLTRAQLKTAKVTAGVITALVDKALAAWISRPVRASAPFDPTGSARDTESIQLTEAQMGAAASIANAGNKPALLFGITGSGKTEVYFELIEEALGAGRQALVLVPEIGLTPQTVQRFTARFNIPIAVFHSGMTDRERLAAWIETRSGAAGIIIGTRSAIFAPLLDPGLIVVDEEHDTSFKQQDGFRYSARDLAVMRGQLEQVPVILGSATPSLESWHNAKTGKYHLATLASRPGPAKPARYQVIDLRNLPLTAGFASQLLDAIRQELNAGNQVLVFLNRRGFSPVLMCRECGFIAQCHRCDARLTVHQAMGMLVCHHCSSQTAMPRTCPECHSSELALLGIGTQRIEHTLTELFSEHRVIRIDRDSTRGKHNMDRFMAEIQKGDPAILVGTQLLAKGHHFPDVTLVAIVDMDAGFYSANYKASERMGQLILQVGGRAGRASKPGVVAIQTHLPDQPIFRQLIEEGYESFADRLLEERQAHELPPFHHHALIRAEATTRQGPMDFLESIANNVDPPSSAAVLGPIPASMERKAGKYRAHLLIGSHRRDALKSALTNCIELGESSPLTRKVRWSVDVDPVDLF